jgi:Sel1 repeat
MPQTPFPPGVPICPRDSEVRWLDPVDAAPNPAEPPPVAELSAIGVRHRVGAGIINLLRLGAAGASVGTLALFVYQGGGHLTGFAGAATRPAGATGQEDAALVVPGGYRQPAARSSDPVERALYYLDRAKEGDPVAQYNVAVFYARGDGLVQDLGARQDLAEAFAWYRRAAERNHPAAQYNLGVAYAEGRGTPRDPVAAARWYHRAAEQGVIPAMVNFAILYEKGEGVARSLPDAYAWYRAAARRGDGAAEQRASELFEGFTGAEKGQAVMLAAAIVDALHEPSAAPAQSSPQPAGPGAAPPVLKPGASAG